MATGLTLSTTSNLNTTQQTLMDDAMEAFEPAAPDPSLVTQRPVPAGHFNYIAATYARLSSASALTEGQDLSQVEQLVTNTITIEPSEHGILCTVSKRLARRQYDSDVVAVAGRQIGNSLRRREALDIIALYDGFSKSIVGNGSALDITYFRGGNAYLMTDNSSSYGPAPMPLQAAFHIEQISDIILDLTDVGTAASRAVSNFDDMMKSWWKGSDRLYGIPIYHSGNIALDSSSDAKGAIFNQQALIEAEEGEAEPTDETDNSLRVVEYGVFKSWGEGEKVDVWGIEVFSDAAATV